jgi:cytochrome c
MKASWTIAVFFTLVHAPLAAMDLPGDSVLGLAVALRNCAGCHAVAEGQGRPATDAAPPFTALGRDPAITAETLRSFLKTPHARMPAVTLSPEDIDHVASYILRMRLVN